MKGHFRRAARRDATEKAIVDALRAAGASIAHLVGRGVPDLLVAHSGRLWLCEVKTKAGELTEEQVKFHASWRGPAPVVIRSVDEALQLLKG